MNPKHIPYKRGLVRKLYFPQLLTPTSPKNRQLDIVYASTRRLQRPSITPGLKEMEKVKEQHLCHERPTNFCDPSPARSRVRILQRRTLLAFIGCGFSIFASLAPIIMLGGPLQECQRKAGEASVTSPCQLSSILSTYLFTVEQVENPCSG